MRLCIILSLSLLLNLTCYNTYATTRTPASINRIIIFGDSLSDTGNDYDFSYLFRKVILKVPSLAKEFPEGLIPSPYSSPYYNGRFSDGKNWLEDFANLFHIRDTERHHFGPLENYAYGGGWASPYSNQGKLAITIFPLDLDEQLLQYQIEHPLPYFDNQHVLAIIFIGANDYLATDTSTPTNIQVKHVISSIIRAIKLLHSIHRISHFLVMGMPNLAETPYAAELPMTEKTLLKNLSIMHNTELNQAIEQLNTNGSKTLPYHISFINWLSDHEALNNNYRKYHFQYGQTQPCHNFYPATQPMHIPLSQQQLFLRLLHHNTDSNITFTRATELSPHPNQEVRTPLRSQLCDNGTLSRTHIYMDDVHPTRLAQCIIALLACQKIEAQYDWRDSRGNTHPLNCGIKPGDSLQQASNVCLKALNAGTLREDTLLPFENT